MVAMNHAFTTNDAAEIIASIREVLSKAYKESSDWDQRSAEDDEEERVNYFVERAFTETLMLLETAGLAQTHEALAELNEQAKADYSECARYSEGIYLVWASKLDSYLEAIESIFVRGKSGKIVKELTDIAESDPILHYRSPLFFLSTPQ
jgi:hypothetical protein